MMRRLLAAVPLLFLGCSTTLVPFTGLKADLLQAQANVKAAQVAGVLEPDDPAAVCLDALAGLLNSTGAAYKVNGLISGGSVAYIQFNASQHAAQGMLPQCDALMGALVREGAKGLIPGGGLLP